MKSTQSCDWWGCDNYADQLWAFDSVANADRTYYCDTHMADPPSDFLKRPGWYLVSRLEHPEGPWWSRAE